MKPLNDISETFCLDLKDLFSSSNPENIEDCLTHVDRKVYETMNSMLSKDFTADEVKTTLFQMNPLGSPGPNGFSTVFYQTHWDIVGGDVTRAILEVLNKSCDISSINETFIVLIPKIKKPQIVSKYRTISLCNVIYKVVSKVLANRLKLILPQLISPTQSTFVPERLILDNVIVAFEAMHSMSSKVKG